jgi:hypothetical protein
VRLSNPKEIFNPEFVDISSSPLSLVYDDFVDEYPIPPRLASIENFSLKLYATAGITSAITSTVKNGTKSRDIK